MFSCEKMVVGSQGVNVQMIVDVFHWVGKMWDWCTLGIFTIG